MEQPQDITSLKQENAALRQRAEAAEQRAEVAEARVAELEGEVTRLKAGFEEAQRAGKRQAGPFAKPKPKLARPKKKPGRTPGDGRGQHAPQTPADEQIDETIEATLPENCPKCDEPLDSDVKVERVAEQIIIEIPIKPHIRRIRIPITHCPACGTRIQGTHPCQHSQAIGAASVQLGPQAIATMSYLHKGLGIPCGKVADLFTQCFELPIARATISRACHRLADLTAPAYDALCETIKQQTHLVVDETSARQNGEKGWLHVCTTPKHHGGMTVYQLAFGPGARGRGPLESLIEIDYPGTLIHDGWAPYDAFESAAHQTCLAHLLRRAHDLAELLGEGRAGLADEIKNVLKQALWWRDRLRDTPLLAELPTLPIQLRDAVLPGQLWAAIRRLEAVADPAELRLANHLRRHEKQLFTFIADPVCPATSFAAEQAIRPAVITRKLACGTRSARGSTTQARLMSIIQTARQQAHAPIAYLRDTLLGLAASLIRRP